MITVTHSAAKRISGLLKEQGVESHALRLMVVSGGCSGFQYMMTLDNETKEDDTEVQIDGVRLLVDSESAPLIKGAEIDFVEGIMRSGFVINNPNAVGSCACGESFQSAQGGGQARPCSH